MNLPRLRPRSLTTNLALLFFGITALAFAVVIFVFLPRLETDLENRQLDDLAASRRRARGAEVEALMSRDITGKELDDSVASLADRDNARVTVLGVQRSNYGARALLRHHRLERGDRRRPELRPCAPRARDDRGGS